MRIVCLRRRVRTDDLGAVLAQALSDVWRYLGLRESVTVGPALMVYHAWDGPLIDFSAGFPVAEPFNPTEPFEVLEIAACTAVTSLHEGGYEKIPALYEAMAAWMRRQGYPPAGHPIEIYWVDSSRAESAEELRTEIAWPTLCDGKSSTQD